MVARVALVTGFEPYGEHDFNPAAGVVQQMDGSEINGVRVSGIVFPASIAPLKSLIRRALAEINPLVVLGIGLWPGEPVIRLERIATNFIDFDFRDSEGRLLADQHLEVLGPAAFYSTLPVRAIQEALVHAGIPARLSSSAGTLLCNMTLYTFLRTIEEGGKPVSCGFMHVPYAPQQVARLIAKLQAELKAELHQRADLASMSVQMMVDAAKIAISVSLDHSAT